ncbi:Jacalin-like lectin domain-containing protein [Hirschfeldia incana]|nr:Jacalin-like lectin domain-containing protein [Hirschfeldia incana]
MNPRHFDLKGHHEIFQILLTEGHLGITSIQFQYVEDGKYVLSDEYGLHSNREQFHTIELNHPVEFISGFSGLYNTSGDSFNITQLTFTTSINECGPFGLANHVLYTYKPKCFSFRLGGPRQFGGFHGTYYSSGLLSIGVYFNPKTMSPFDSEIPEE